MSLYSASGTVSPAEKKNMAAIQRTKYFKDGNDWVCLKGYLQAEVADAWQVKARKILFYYREEHNQEERVEGGM